MRARVMWALSLAVLFVGSRAVLAQRPAPRFDLQGTWNGSTRTPLQRPQQFIDRFAFTPEEAAEYLRATPDRVRSRLPTAADRQVQIDLDETYSEVERMPLDGLRTSLIVDPPSGMLPPLLPAAQARKANRPKRSLDDPETFGLAERCLLGNFGASGGSLASPPMIPSEIIPVAVPNRPDRYARADLHRVGARCAHRPAERYAPAARYPQLARGFDRTLRRRDAGRGHDELPT